MPTKVIEQNDTTHRYAGFWLRSLALTIDWTIIYLPFILLGIMIVLLTMKGNIGLPDAWSIYIKIIALLLPIIYFVLSHSGVRQATIGKRICHIYVGNASDNARLSFGRSAIRFIFLFLMLCITTIDDLSFIVSNVTAKKILIAFWLILLLTHVMAAFNKEKTALHDKLFDTRVFLGKPGLTNHSYQYNYFSYYLTICALLLLWGAFVSLVKSPATAIFVWKIIVSSIIIAFLVLLFLKRLGIINSMNLDFKKDWGNMKLLFFSFLPSILLYCFVYLIVFNAIK